MTKAKCTCIVCNSQFNFKAEKSNKYCGMACYRIAQKRGDYLGFREAKRKYKCSHCGSEVAGKSKSTTRNGGVSENIFCNRDCYDAFRSAIKNKPKGECLNCSVVLTNENTNNPNPKYCSNACKLEHKKSKDRYCISCGVWFSSLKWNRSAGRLVADNARKTCSEECYIEQIKTNKERKEKISNAFAGASHPNWQGGSSYLSDRGFRGSNWQMIRQQIIERDGFKCVRCGIGRTKHYERYHCDFNVNHKKPFHQFGGKTKLANKPSNLETLCKSCHTKADWQYRKANPIQQILCFA